jgi:hypothetical protein
MRRTLTRLSYLATAVALSLAAACGHQTSDTLGGPCSDSAPDVQCPTTCGSTQPVCSSGSWACPDVTPGVCPAQPDGGEDAGTCLGTPPQLPCGYNCGSEQWSTAFCLDGNWQCPVTLDLPACIEDAGGPDACSNYPPIACSNVSPCTGVYQIPACSGGDWYCEQVGQCEDGGQPYWDSGVPDAPPPSFSCGDLACDPATSYCQINTGGVAQPDGGAGSSYSCLPLPSSCNGLQPTCDCVEAFNGVSNNCGCVGENGEVIFTCAVP